MLFLIYNKVKGANSQITPDAAKTDSNRTWPQYLLKAEGILTVKQIISPWGGFCVQWRNKQNFIDQKWSRFA